MHPIDMPAPSREFLACFNVAGARLDGLRGGGPFFWLKAQPLPPFLEHLSFRLGNQLFFVRLEDVDGVADMPGAREGLRRVATACAGHACLMPMRRAKGQWLPVAPGVGLVDLDSGQPLHPPALVTDERIGMTDWECQDFAVQIVRDDMLEDSSLRLMSWQGDPEVDPSLWVMGKDGPEYVVVRWAAYPAIAAQRPRHVEEIKARCAALSRRGHFASVCIASFPDMRDDFSPGRPCGPLWRGTPLFVQFAGVEPL